MGSLQNSATLEFLKNTASPHHSVIADVSIFHGLFPEWLQSDSDKQYSLGR